MSVSKATVSLVWYGKNRLQWVESEVESLFEQSHVGWQLLVEDGGSTDGTLEWFLRRAEQDKRIDVVSKAASSPGEALLRGLRRCAGDYIVICPRHAGLMSDALEFAVQTLECAPELGALACRGLLIDAEGEPAAVPFDLAMALFTPLRISAPSGVIRRSALIESGLLCDDWRTGCLILDLWCRLATDHDIGNVDRAIVRGRAGRDVEDFAPDTDHLVEDCVRFVASLFEEKNFLANAADLSLQFECLANQLCILNEELGSTAVNALRRAKRDLAYRLVYHVGAERRGFGNIARWHRMWRLPDGFQRLAWMCGSSHPDRAAATTRSLAFLASYVRPLCWPFVRRALQARSRKLGEEAGRDLPLFFADVYAELAERYNSRGQVETAIHDWRLAEPLGDAMVDSVALQAEIKRPGATEASLAKVHKRWAMRHADAMAKEDHGEWPRWDGRRRIRIGYHCAFMDSDTIRYMMGRVLQAHDRDRFEIHGYSPIPVASDIVQGFDAIRDTSTTEADPERVPFHNSQMISHGAFRQMIRADGIDVFVELSGFSPGHRFSAMAARCAPVQVSFLNHTASSQVRNVDYILADEICLPKASGFEELYSEEIYRLPGCFFCFDYRGWQHPSVAKPPSLAKGYVTFGCFGHAGKLNFQLLQLWAELMRQIPSAKLHIQNPQIKNEHSRRFLRERFRNLGVTPDRLILATGLDRESLLNVYADIDISLDTWPYCGGNSIAEALWHGVPVITLKDDRFSSRYGASLVTAAGCPDLVADSSEQYIAIAKRLAGNPARLADLRQRLRDMSIEHGLGDSAAFARRLEHAYIDMLSRVGSQRMGLELATRVRN